MNYEDYQNALFMKITIMRGSHLLSHVPNCDAPSFRSQLKSLNERHIKIKFSIYQTADISKQNIGNIFTSAYDTCQSAELSALLNKKL